jgi:peptidoglycan-associated lipoprotein
MSQLSSSSLRLLGALAIATVLAACGSTVPLNQPPVESKTPTPVTPAPAPGTATAPASPQAAQPQSQVASVDVSRNAAAAAPRERSVFFDFDSFVIRDEFKPLLEAHARALSAQRAQRIVVEGHTDERGGREYNLALGQKRAEAVTRALTLLGVSENQLEAVSFGKERPAAQGSTEEAWAKNRRAELKDR